MAPGMSKPYRIICPSPAFAMALTEVLAMEGHMATWLVTDQGPVVLTEATPRAMTACLQAVRS